MEQPTMRVNNWRGVMPKLRKSCARCKKQRINWPYAKVDRSQETLCPAINTCSLSYYYESTYTSYWRWRDECYQRKMALFRKRLASHKSKEMKP